MNTHIEGWDRLKCDPGPAPRRSRGSRRRALVGRPEGAFRVLAGEFALVGLVGVQFGLGVDRVVGHLARGEDALNPVDGVDLAAVAE